MPGPDDGDDTPGNQPGGKVARLIEKYDLQTRNEDFGAYLEAKWTAPSEDRMSLRKLTEEFNKRVLRAAMVEAGHIPVEGEIENLYRLLTSDEVSDGSRQQAVQRLEQWGVDVDEVQSDFVSYQSIRSYLKYVRGAEYDKQREIDPERVIQAIRRLQQRSEAIVSQNIEKLKASGAVTVGEYTVRGMTVVECESCGTQKPAVQFVQDGGCECQKS